MVGAALAKKFGWKVGDRIPLKATIWPKKNGSNTWTFQLVGIFHATSTKQKFIENAMFFRWKYFDEARQFANGTVGWYQEKLTSPDQADRVAQTIDTISANSSHETKTETVNAFTASMLSQLANIGLIVTAIMAAVFFTLILLTGNTMAQAVRERTSELAVLKTLGFSNRGVLGIVLAESVLLVLIGGLIGMGLVAVISPIAGASSGGLVRLPPVGASSWGLGIGLMIVIGLLVGALPAIRAMRLNMVDALAGR